ncbi:MAG: AbrB/MazE/SpoVT family DNA-binding domain-containing protein [Acidobacteriaceae bacterium]
MATTAKVTTVGSSTGIVLPKEMLERLHLRRGDSVYLTETPTGVHLTPYRPDFAEAIEAGRRVMRRYRNTLRKLAE